MLSLHTEKIRVLRKQNKPFNQNKKFLILKLDLKVRKEINVHSIQPKFEHI